VSLHSRTLSLTPFDVHTASASKFTVTPHIAYFIHIFIIMSAVTAEERINKEHTNRIRKALREKKLVIIAGAGLSLSAFDPPPERLFWKGLIKDGLQYMEDTGLIDPEDEELLFHRRVLDWKAIKMKTMLRTCNYLRDELDEHGKFPTWLDSAFSTLLPDVRHPEVFDPIRELHRRGAHS
jgi:hypothetical protein